MADHTHSPYLEDIPLSDALARWWAALAEAGVDVPLPGEPVPLDEAAGRTTAEPVWARISSPHYHAAAMDGYAVRAEATRGASETQPVYLTVGEQAFYVDTGDPLPPGTNAVIMVEDVQVRDARIEILAAVAPWQHVRPMGEDMVATELILAANHRLRPQDIGAAAGAGHTELSVRRRPRVAIQPTGTELVAPGATLHPGAIIEYNSLVLAAMVREWGGLANRLPPLADDYAAIRDRVLAVARDHDLVIINAGLSAGSEDFTARIVAELGRTPGPRHRHPPRPSGDPGYDPCAGRIIRKKRYGRVRCHAARSTYHSRHRSSRLPRLRGDHVRAAGETDTGALAGAARR